VGHFEIKFDKCNIGPICVKLLRDLFTKGSNKQSMTLV
jgi:hypothetical protein